MNVRGAGTSRKQSFVGGGSCVVRSPDTQEDSKQGRGLLTWRRWEN